MGACLEIYVGYRPRIMSGCDASLDETKGTCTGSGWENSLIAWILHHYPEGWRMESPYKTLPAIEQP